MEEPTGPGQSEWSDQQYARALTMRVALLEVASGCAFLLAGAALLCVTAALSMSTGHWLIGVGGLGLGVGVRLNITGIRRLRGALTDLSSKPTGKR